MAEVKKPNEGGSPTEKEQEVPASEVAKGQQNTRSSAEKVLGSPDWNLDDPEQLALKKRWEEFLSNNQHTQLPGIFKDVGKRWGVPLAVVQRAIVACLEDCIRIGKIEFIERSKPNFALSPGEWERLGVLVAEARKKFPVKPKIVVPEKPESKAKTVTISAGATMADLFAELDQHPQADQIFFAELYDNFDDAICDKVQELHLNRTDAAKVTVLSCFAKDIEELEVDLPIRFSKKS